MDPIYTPQDHERLAEICGKIIRDNDSLPDEEMGILATNLMLNVLMRVPKETRNLALLKIMTCLKKAIVNPEVR